jgi:HEAT repeat protein
MTTRSIIPQAERLIAQSRVLEARDLLLEAGYQNLDKKVQEAYDRLIPPNDILEKQLAGPLKDLKSSDPAERLRAARAISRQALKMPTREREAWLKDPRTMSPLIEALEDSEPRVVEEAVTAVEEICRRYYRDQRAYPRLVRLLQSKSATTRYCAVKGVGILGGEGSFEEILPLLKDRAVKVRTQVCSVVTNLAMLGQLSDQLKQRLEAPMLEAFSDTAHEVRSAAACALREIGGRSALPELEKLLAKEKNGAMKDVFAMAIAAIRGRC